MKGYDTSNGYMGYVEGKYILFASEREYFEFILLSKSLCSIVIVASSRRASFSLSSFVRYRDWLLYQFRKESFGIRFQ